jgi:hypothetical protein
MALCPGPAAGLDFRCSAQPGAKEQSPGQGHCTDEGSVCTRSQISAQWEELCPNSFILFPPKA